MTSNGTIVNSQDDETEETRLLYLAVRKGLTNQVRVFLEHGANVNARNARGETPLHAAVVGYLSDCTKELLRHGADVCAVNDDGDTPLHLAARFGLLDCVRDLSTYGSNVNARNKKQKTPLHEAAEFGSLDCISVLLEYEANVNAQDERGDTPLHEVTRFSLLGCIKVLLASGASVHAENKKGETPLHIAVQNSSLNCVKELLVHGAEPNEENNEGETPLHLAADSDLPDYIKLLLEHEAEVNDTNAKEKTPLHIAVQKSGSDCVKVLLANGANVNAENEEGETPLHEALLWGRWNNAELLLEHGACINAQDSEGNYPIHAGVLADSPEDVRSVLNLLIKHGADLESLNLSGQTPAHILCLKARSTLIEDPTAINKVLRSMTVLFSFGVDVNAKDADGDTPYTCITGEMDDADSGWLRDSFLAYHVRKLIALGAARVVEKNRPLFFEVMNLYNGNNARLLQEIEMKSTKTERDDYYEICVAELHKLRAIRVLPNIRMSDVLTLSNPLSLAKVSGNMNYQRFVESARLDVHFPIYSFLISMQHRRGLKMKLLHEDCVTSLETLSSGKLNRDCAYDILQHLSESELENLNEAGREMSGLPD